MNQRTRAFILIFIFIFINLVMFISLIILGINGFSFCGDISECYSKCQGLCTCTCILDILIPVIVLGVELVIFSILSTIRIEKKHLKRERVCK